MGALNEVYMANVGPSRYLEETLFKTQTSVADRLFETVSDQLFEASNGGSFVEISVQEQNESESSNGTRFYAWLNKDDSQLSDIDFSCRGISPESHSPLEAVKMVLDPGSPKTPSRYMGENGIFLYTACEPMELSNIAAQSQDVFRICFVRQRHTNNRLLMSRELFETLMSTFQIFPLFRDFVVCFGFRQIDAGVGPPQLRFRIITADGHHSEGIKNVGFECAYELRYVELNPRYVRNPWRLRRTVVYQQHKFSNRSSSWVVVSASSDTESSIDQYIKSAGDLTLQSPFEMHLLLFQNALSNWRPYTAHLSGVINEQSDRVLARFSDESYLRPTQAIQELHHLKDTEDELTDVHLALDSLHDTVVSLSDNYAECVISSGQTFTGEHDTVHRASQTQLKDIAFTSQNVQSLRSKVRGTRDLLSSLQSLQKCAPFAQIGQQRSREIAFTPRTKRESVYNSPTVDVLTVSVLLYLPVVVVCSFFSTHFVGMEKSADGNRLTIASNAWWLLVVSAPLIIISLIAWYIWLRLTVNRRERHQICQQIAPMTRV